ncbi:conserved hypothetical protein [Deferribacter desulfuricans SSM1]|uniref:Outer membrane lipoprotein BamD-like domain-containing protein n=1 Tax=Deferribacter desulfuricans (strain DSM 14783 / JCM 11476 / NBRC 101012 / SSM1) TaxID=639282 RepID=D3PEB3_DEFDS|nr:hypothetical protein [Deferribacter desulfuricans]BAI80936.1 conserved hypothetical protein [Deferribacter desulfuricans SSM1]
MKKWFILLIAFLLGCGAKTAPPDYLRVGENYFKSYVKTYLSGNKKLAEKYFDRALMQFQKSDDICNISRLYLKRFFVEEEINPNASSYIQSANYYATIGKCNQIEEVIEFYNLNKKIDLNRVNDDFYKHYIQFLEKGKYEGIVKIIDNYPDYVKSKVYRQIAEELKDKDKALSQKFIEKAYQLDKFNSYSLYLLLDLKLKYYFCKKYKKGYSNLEKRLNMLEKMIKK